MNEKPKPKYAFYFAAVWFITFSIIAVYFFYYQNQDYNLFALSFVIAIMGIIVPLMIQDVRDKQKRYIEKQNRDEAPPPSTDSEQRKS